MSGVATAIAGAAVIGAVVASNSASKAASAQTGAANQANATQGAQYNQTRLDQLPWMNRGNSAGNQLAYLMGLPGYGPPQGSNVSSNPWGGTDANGRNPMDPMRSGGVGSGGQPVWTGADGRVIWDPSTLGIGFNTPNGGFLNDLTTRAYNQMGTVQVDPGTGLPLGQTASTGSGPQINTQMGGYGSLSTPFSQTNWQLDPGYAFRLSEGQKALERSGAARGMTLSGAQQKALLSYGQGMGSQEYGAAYGRYQNDQTNLFNRLSGIAGTGQQANQFVGQLGSNMANQVSGNMMNLGAGQSANALAQGNAWMGALNNGVNQWQNYNAWNSMQGGGGGGSYNYNPWGGQLYGSGNQSGEVIHG